MQCSVISSDTLRDLQGRSINILEAEVAFVNPNPVLVYAHCHQILAIRYSFEYFISDFLVASY